MLPVKSSVMGGCKKGNIRVSNYHAKKKTTWRDICYHTYHLYMMQCSEIWRSLHRTQQEKSLRGVCLR